MPLVEDQRPESHTTPTPGVFANAFSLAPGPLGPATMSWVGLIPNSCYPAIIL